MPNAEKLAQGAKKATYVSGSLDCQDMSADFALGQDSHFMREKYGLTKEQYEECLNSYLTGEPYPAIFHPEPETEAVHVMAEETPEMVPAPKPEWHYEATPRHDFVLIIRLSKEHSSRVVIPDSCREKSDVGIVWRVGPEVDDLIPGDIVLFDKYATVGQNYELLDEEGDMQEFLMLQEIHVAATLVKKKVRCE